MDEFIREGEPPLVSGITVPHPCKCGCGEMIEDEPRSGKPTRFVNDRHQKNYRNRSGYYKQMEANRKLRRQRRMFR
jgi:hypothetical protein